MRVGLMCSNDLGLKGPGVYFEGLIKNLAKENDVEVYLIGFQRSRQSSFFGKINQIMIPRIPLFLEHCIKKYHLDIVHFNAIWEALYFPCSKAKKVATVHGDIHWAIPSLDYHISRAPLKRIADLIGHNFLDAFIAVSYDLKQRISRYMGISASKIFVTHLAPRDVFRPISGEKLDYLKSKYGIEKPFILHVSNFGPKKNPETVFLTFKTLIEKHFDLELILSGSGWKTEKKVKEMVAELGLSDYVKFLGFVPLEELALLYNSAEVFFQPSFHENCPQTILEAMSCGAPVVTSSVFSIPEVTGNAGILHNPRDYMGFVESIEKILLDEKYRKDLQARTLENAQRFSWEKTTQQTLEVYKKLMA